MSEPNKALTRNRFAMVGRIESVKRKDGVFYHGFLLPAPDEYSRPQFVEVRANRKLGEPGEDVTVPVSVCGFIKSFEYTDRQTGERLKGTDPRAWFQVDG